MFGFPKEGQAGEPKKESEQGHTHGCFENACRTTTRAGAGGGGDHHLGALGERPWKAPRPAASLDVRIEAPRKAAGKQEQTEGRGRRLARKRPIAALDTPRPSLSRA